MITLPPLNAPGRNTPAATDSSTISVNRSPREHSRTLVEIASPPARLPALQQGESVTASISERLPDGKLAATIKGEAFVLTLPKGMIVDGNVLPLRVAVGPPLAFSLLDGLQDPAAALRSSELAKAVSAALQDESSIPLQTLSQPGKLPELQRGELVSARLAERLADGSAMVLVKNGAFNLKAPENAVLSKEPMLLRVSGTSPMVQFDLLQLAQAPDEKSAPVAFSAGGRYLNTLLDAAVGKAAAHAGLTLLSDPAGPGGSDQLQKTVEKSGVFYESHQRAWVDGRLSLDELKQEPQARLPHDGKGVSAELGQLVQKQLDVHEQRSLMFQGQAWPGQPVAWEVQRDEIAERDANSGQDTPVWQTRLNLELPALGGVGARLRLVGKQVQVVFDAADDETASLIEQHRARLNDGMAAAGLALASLLIRHGAADEA